MARRRRGKKRSGLPRLPAARTRGQVPPAQPVAKVVEVIVQVIVAQRVVILHVVVLIIIVTATCSKI